ncbi:MAG: cysteine synthase family protein [Proteobacteria bacterium]|nr:cysteine synthase family protein [Pseudomonadota bacterium]MBU1585102.1 cysteine synthase family protein [Pseudomonadota bacterium]MBU2627564.1 cysteine synthase family protein [Pseudomonadota bacterium]
MIIGNTPIIRLENMTGKESASVYVKLEKFNQSGSIKARVAQQMILDAEMNGVLTPNIGQTLIEPTGGNTGAGLAMIGAKRGYEVILVIPDNFSKEKTQIMQLYGAKVIHSNSKLGNDSHIKLVEEIVQEKPNYVYLNQFTNPSNPKAHYKFTGNEILKELDNIDCFVAGVGSGGTITGIGKRLKEINKNTLIYGVQPKGCDVINGIGVKHKIEGIGLGIIPPVLPKN